jgi:hypothetical protein
VDFPVASPANGAYRLGERDLAHQERTPVCTAFAPCAGCVRCTARYLATSPDMGCAGRCTRTATARGAI